MPADSRIAQLAASLIKQGFIPQEAFRYASNYLAESKMNRGTFMALLAVEKKKEKFTSTRQAIQSGTLKPGRKEERTIQIGTENFHYTITTTLPASLITPIITDTFVRWMQFGQGTSSLGGRRLKHPSGRYASSLVANQTSGSSFTIYSNSPYADVLEKGRQPYNLNWGKTPFDKGQQTKIIPIGKNSLVHMGKSPLTAASVRSYGGYRTRLMPSAKVSGATARMAEKVYGSRYGNGDFRTVSKDSQWKIDSRHPMKVYSPALHLYELMQKKVKSAERGL